MIVVGRLLLSCCWFRWSVVCPPKSPPVGHDPSPHKIQFVTVDKDVKLEVLDWGGSGRPLVLLAGLGATAHVFDDFAPKLVNEYHVYGITRRGYGASSVPISGYSADRLGDDVVAVLDALKLDKVVLVGHSMGGEELSSVATRHRERIAGLIYLEAGYPYAYYDASSQGDFMNVYIDWDEFRKRVEQALAPGNQPATEQKLVGDLLKTSLPSFERDLQQLDKTPSTNTPAIVPPKETAADDDNFVAYRAYLKRVLGVDIPEADLREGRESTSDGHVGPPKDKAPITQAMLDGMEKYTDIRAPVLAIFAAPHELGPYAQDNPALQAFYASDADLMRGFADAFKKGVPSARVVLLPHANHMIFLSNEADVLREMRAFLASLH